MDELNQQSQKYKLFADDIVVFGTLQNLLEAVKVIEKWAVEHNMIISKKKSAFMKIGGLKPDEKDKNKTHMGYEVVSKYKYLGMDLSENL